MYKTVIIATLTTISIVAPAAIAQQPQQPAGRFGGPPPGRQKQIDGSWFNLQKAGFEMLPKPVELPGVPVPPGAKFKYGQVTRDKGVTSIAERFATGHDMASLVTWYKQSLEQYGWKVLGKSGTSVTAQKKHDSCVVQLMKTSTPGMTSDVYLAVKMSKEQ